MVAPLLDFMNMKQTKRKVEEMVGSAKEEIKHIDINGKTIKSVSDLRQDKGMRCTIKQFLTYTLDLTPSAKFKIVKSQMPVDDPRDKPKGGYQWFRHALKTIKEAIISSDSSVIIKTIAELETYEYDKSKGNERYDIPNSLETLTKYFEIKLPEPFNHLRKTQIKLKDTSIVFNGITMILKPDLVFTATLKGKPVVGAVKLIARKQNQLGRTQLRMGAHLIHEYLQINKANFEGEIMRELCVYIDVVYRKVEIAPDANSVPNREIREACKSFSDIWNQEITKNVKP